MEDNLEEVEGKKKFFKDTKNIIIILLSILLVIVTSGLPGTSVETSNALTEKENKIISYEKNIEDLQKENKLLLQEKQDLESDKKKLQQEKNNLENEINKLQQEKLDFENQKNTIELENKNLKDQVEQLKKTSAINNSSSNTLSPKKQTSTTTQNTKSTIVYITRTGEKYHKSNCSYLRQSKIEINLSEAKRLGYTPCSRCY